METEAIVFLVGGSFITWSLVIAFRNKRTQHILPVSVATCDHKQFEANATIHKIMRPTSTKFQLQILAKCAHCRRNFVFTGLPTLTADRKELSIEINWE